jgi:hypothetical protein
MIDRQSETLGHPSGTCFFFFFYKNGKLEKKFSFCCLAAIENEEKENVALYQGDEQA